MSGAHIVYNLLISNHKQRSILQVSWHTSTHQSTFFLCILVHLPKNNKTHILTEQKFWQCCLQLLCSHVVAISVSSSNRSRLDEVWVGNTHWTPTMLTQGLHHAVKSIIHLTSHLTAMVMERRAELVMPKWSWLILVSAYSQCFSSGVSSRMRQRCQSQPETRPFAKFGAANQYNITDCYHGVNEALVRKWMRQGGIFDVISLV